MAGMRRLALTFPYTRRVVSCLVTLTPPFSGACQAPVHGGSPGAPIPECLVQLGRWLWLEQGAAQTLLAMLR